MDSHIEGAASRRLGKDAAIANQSARGTGGFNNPAILLRLVIRPGELLTQCRFRSVFTVVIMIFGVTLFLNLARVLFNPSKVRFNCPACGLSRHDRDAVHCKACGGLLNIPDEGAA